MSTPQTIFAAQHDPFTRIGVQDETKTPEGGLVLSLYRTGASKPQRWRYNSPSRATDWFADWSKANLEAWREAYHRSGLGARDFARPGGASMDDTQAIVVPRLVPYHSQRDNERSPSGTCNVTSYAMWLDYYDLPTLSKKYAQIEDNLELWMHQRDLERTNHEHLVKMARAHRLDASFETNVSLAEMRARLERGWGLVVSGKFTSAGHIVCVYGTSGTGFLVNDPWGSYLTGYKNHNGASLLYSEAVMRRVLIEARPDSGAWVHTIKGVLR